jgi:hypothetical protein
MNAAPLPLARPQTSLIVAYKAHFGVEPICRVLTEHDMPIAPSTYLGS